MTDPRVPRPRPQARGQANGTNPPPGQQPGPGGGVPSRGSGRRDRLLQKQQEFQRAAPEVRPVTEQEGPFGLPQPVLRAIAVVATLIVVGTGIWYVFFRNTSNPVPVIACGARGGVELCDYPDRAWLSFYDRHERKLGLPQEREKTWGRKPNCIRFSNYVLCANPDAAARGTLREFIPEPLGLQYAIDARIPINRAAELPAIVRAYVEASSKNPLSDDPAYWLGAVMTDAYDVGGRDGLSIQCFEWACLNWPPEATDPRQITTKSLGEGARP
jgi:hypothetical protein